MRRLAGAVLIAATSLHADTYTVTTAADSGPGSLRQAIEDANSGACAAPCSIVFAAGGGVMTIEPLTPLPPITADRVRIGAGPASAWRVEISGRRMNEGSGLRIRARDCGVNALVINGFAGSGIVVERGSATIASNVIGLDPAGTTPVPNGQNGITIINSGVSVDSNTIGGNRGNGVYVADSSQVAFGLNHIGKQYLPQGSGETPLPNGASGVFLANVRDVVFLANTITNSGLAGVAVVGDSSTVRIQSRQLPSLIFGNGDLPIDLGFDGPHGNAPNAPNAPPALERAQLSNGFVLVRGTVSAAPRSEVDVNVFASDTLNRFGTGEAKQSLHAGTITTGEDGNGVFEFRFPLYKALTGSWISATATSPAGTSELSAPLQLVRDDQIHAVLNTNDSGPGSLRQAILDVNAGPCFSNFPCRIEFQLPPPVPPASHSTIAPLTPFPPITRSGVILDGGLPPGNGWDFSKRLPRVEIDGSRSTPGDGLTIAARSEPMLNVVIRGLAINGFRGDGIVIDGTSAPVAEPVIAGNFIGTDPGGTEARPNSGSGIRVRGTVPFLHNGTFSSGNRIVANLISGNDGEGVTLEGGFFELEGNLVGTDRTGTLPLPNGGAGLRVDRGGQCHPEGNTFAFNRKAGVSIADPAAPNFNGVIGNRIHGNGGLGVDLREPGPTPPDPAIQSPPEITSATYDAATGVGTVTGTYVRSPLATFGGFSPVLDFALSTFPERDGRGAAETPIYVNTELTVDGDRVAFRGRFQNVDPRGKRIAATLTPFSYHGWKGAPPENQIFGQGFRYGTTSEMSGAIPVVTTGCPAALPEIVSPRDGAGVRAGEVELRWNTVAGATSYQIYLRRVPGLPERIAAASGATATVTLAAGDYEWFVEAVFDGCPPNRSDAEAMRVVSSRRRAIDASGR